MFSIGVVGLLLVGAIGYVVYTRMITGPAAETKPVVIAPKKAPVVAPTIPVVKSEPEPAPAAPPPVPATPVETVPVPSVPADTPAPEPSPAFKAWVTNLKIGAVRAGAVPRLLIGGRMFSRGDVVGPELGIVFEAYDTDRRMLRFKDATGATFERRDH